MIHMANAMVDDYSEESNSDNESTNSSEWQVQMSEVMKPVVLIANDRPPSEPPPSLETITPHIEETQWVEDVITTAVQSLSLKDAHNATELSTSKYTPRIKKLSTNRAD